MKHRIYIVLLFLFSGIACIAQPVVSFGKTIHHLGFVRQGDTLHFSYAFTNKGNQPLLITDAKVECGCTVVDKPIEPILPGKQGVITVIFHTNDAMDRQNRTITILSNATNSPATLRFKCIVLKRKK